MIKGIIFDLDGTLLNTLYDIQDSLNVVFNNHNLKTRTYDEVRLAVGKGSRNLIKDSLQKNVDDNTIDELLEEYIKVYGKGYNIKTKPYDDIKELLNEIEKRNIVIAVNSNKPDAFTKDLIKTHFPKNKFVSVIGSRANVPNKPDPYSTNEIISLMKLNKDEVLYVGDSESDIKTAKNVKIKSVGCLWGFRDFKTLKDVGADIIISNPKELLNYLQ